MAFKIILSLRFAGVVHENPKIGSDGESEEGSRTSEDVVSPANRGSAAAAGGIGGMTNGQVKMRHKPPSGVSSAGVHTIHGGGGGGHPGVVGGGMGTRKLSSQVIYAAPYASIHQKLGFSGKPRFSGKYYYDGTTVLVIAAT